MDDLIKFYDKFKVKESERIQAMLISENQNIKALTCDIVSKIYLFLKFKSPIINLIEILNDFSPPVVNYAINQYMVYFRGDISKSRILFVNCDEKVANRVTIFLYAILDDHIQFVEYLLENYIPNIELEYCFYIDDEKVDGITAAWLSVYYNHEDILKLLIKHGADVNHGTKQQSTLLRVACYDNKINIVRLLIENGADVNKANNFNNTPLMLVAYLGNYEIAQVLVENGADINAQALCGETALHFAAQQGNLEIVKYLLSLNAQFLTDKNGLTPLLEAARHGQEDVVKELISIPNLISISNRIKAYEILGTSNIFMNANFQDFVVNDVYKHFVTAFKYRYCNLSKDSLDYIDPNTVKIENKNSLPAIPKETVKPFIDNQTYEECQTLAQLNSIEKDFNHIIIEGLLILERILGDKSMVLAESLIETGANLIDINQHKACFLLWNHGITIKINARFVVSEDFNRFVRAMYLIVRRNSIEYFVTNYLDNMEDIFFNMVKFYKLQSLQYGYQELFEKLNYEQSAQVEKFQSKHLENYQSFRSVHWNIAMDDVDSAIVGLLYLCGLFAMIYDYVPKEQCIRIEKLLMKLCQMNITSKLSGATLLHLALSQSFIQSTCENFFINLSRTKSMFSPFKVAKLLIKCGSMTNVYDRMYNTPLHYFTCFQLEDNTLEDILDMLDIFQTTSIPRAISNSMRLHCSPHYAGLTTLHIDAVNALNQVAFQSFSTTSQDNILLQEVSLSHITLQQHNSFNNQIFSLKCLAARSLHLLYMRCHYCQGTVREEIGESTKINPRDYDTHYGWHDEDRELFISHESTPELCYLSFYNQQLSTYANKPQHLTKHYKEHKLIEYNWQHVWRMTKYFRRKLNIPIELVQFIELHGPCKFTNLTLPDGYIDDDL